MCKDENYKKSLTLWPYGPLLWTGLTCQGYVILLVCKLLVGLKNFPRPPPPLPRPVLIFVSSKPFLNTAFNILVCTYFSLFMLV